MCVYYSLCFMQAMATVLKEEYGVELAFGHSYSSEVNSRKRNFIRGVHPHDAPLFGDVGQLTNSQARNFAEHAMEQSQVVVDVPRNWTHFVGGFPCKSVSDLNRDRLQHRNSITNRSGKTGSVFGSILDVITKENTEIQGGVFENVMGLMKSAQSRDGEVCSSGVVGSCLGQVVSALWRIGLTTATFKLDPRCFGHPQSRPRLYILVWPMEVLHKLGMDEVAAYELAVSVMDSLATGHGMVPLDDLMLPESSELVQGMLNTGARAGAADEGDDTNMGAEDTEPVRTRPRANKVGKVERWPLQHYHLSAAVQQQWWKPSSATPELVQRFPGIGLLPDRSLDLLQHMGVVYPEEQLRLVETSQSMNRCHIAANCTPCVIPRTVAFVVCYLVGHLCVHVRLAG